MADTKEKPATETQDTKDKTETQPAVEPSTKDTKDEPEITSNIPDDSKEEKKEDMKQEDEESELSSSDEEDELIDNTEEWDITFKLAQFLDNHFIIDGHKIAWDLCIRSHPFDINPQKKRKMQDVVLFQKNQMYRISLHRHVQCLK
eukprot:800024_1